MKPVGVLHHFVTLAKAAQTIHITGMPNQLLDFLHVSDAVQAIAKALIAPSLGPIYNIGSGTGNTLSDLARAAWLLSNPTSELRLISTPAVKSPAHQVLDIQRARKDLGYEPVVSLASGLRTMLQKS